ncbi:MAG: hypothetical protein KJ601_04900 [Nanoarchaeota archaeon]|nr:hypothetical protein [Nanoarchaeota archaeon]MBU1704079.1 hypothetical protein [Nanoarchaeota archaeon]
MWEAKYVVNRPVDGLNLTYRIMQSAGIPRNAIVRSNEQYHVLDGACRGVEAFQDTPALFEVHPSKKGWRIKVAEMGSGYITRQMVEDVLQELGSSPNPQPLHVQSR